MKAETLYEAAAYQIQIRDNPTEDWCPITAVKGSVVTESQWCDDKPATAEQAAWVRRYLPNTEVRVIERAVKTQTVSL
jgi:hypothetical protein